MTENTFFDNWAGRSVDFATAGTPSKWILTELLSEKNSQVHGDDFFKNGCIGGAYGTFLCHNVTDSTQRGVMKVLMQVPWEGSQYAPAEHRSSQASASYELDWNMTSQLNALITLTSNNCLSTPWILDLKYGWQETADPVPGGYIIFILMSYLPGVQLTKAFWGLEDSVREQIRQAFKLTWLDCVGSGITPAHPNIEHVFWDAAANKAYVVFPVNNERSCVLNPETRSGNGYDKLAPSLLTLAASYFPRLYSNAEPLTKLSQHHQTLPDHHRTSDQVAPYSASVKMHYIQYGIGCLLSLLLTGAKGHEDKLFTRGPAFSAYPYPTFFIECPEIGASGSRMDIAHVYDGSGYFPELRWPITTPDTQEYVLVCEDPDEPLAAPVIHGLYYRIPPVFISLHRSDFIEVDSRNDPYRLRGGFKYGANSGGGVYLAPQPARGQGPHRYFFELIALNHTIDQSKLSPMATFDEIARQIEGKIIGWVGEMTDNTFFENWEGRQVHFPWDGPSTWTLTRLISEKNSQVHARDYYNGTIGGAYATFLCHNFVDSTQRGVMKIFKQVPFEGSENATIQQRGAQASQELDYFITSQLRALNTLTQISPTR
ncbi:hypothetical protein G4B84_007891 [Aspergillus flavus NRRL3357]|nr:uncharacterized protein G4B84_007891 [Aspergillus flavus NRRL3357]QMW32460.1 hypothetical protein G4B84_007891 [Aspergillus flavus NRRL3357]